MSVPAAQHQAGLRLGCGRRAGGRQGGYGWRRQLHLGQAEVPQHRRVGAVDTGVHVVLVRGGLRHDVPVFGLPVLRHRAAEPELGVGALPGPPVHRQQLAVEEIVPPHRAGPRHHMIRPEVEHLRFGGSAVQRLAFAHDRVGYAVRLANFLRVVLMKIHEHHVVGAVTGRFPHRAVFQHCNFEGVVDTLVRFPPSGLEFVEIDV